MHARPVFLKPAMFTMSWHQPQQIRHNMQLSDLSRESVITFRTTSLRIASGFDMHAARGWNPVNFSIFHDLVRPGQDGMPALRKGLASCVAMDQNLTNMVHGSKWCYLWPVDQSLTWSILAWWEIFADFDGKACDQDNWLMCMRMYNLSIWW